MSPISLLREARCFLRNIRLVRSIDGTLNYNHELLDLLLAFIVLIASVIKQNDHSNKMTGIFMKLMQ